MNMKFNHLYKTYGTVQAVVDATFATDKKQFIVLAGPSGCGKTTLLHLIAGFLKPDRGEIWLDEERIDKRNPDKRDIAMVFQEAALFPHMSVYDNIALGLEHSGISKAETHTRVMDMATLVGIDMVLQRKAKDLSNGQKQRVSIARALVRSPKLFLMDEPLSALDARLKAQLRIEIAQLYHKMDATFLYVTHDQIEAMTLADILIIMKDGSFQQIGAPMEIYQNPCNLFTASFLGKFDINRFAGRLQENYLCFANEKIALKEQYENQRVLLAVRPEHIYIDDEKGLDGIVVLVENLGDEIYYHIRWREDTIIMKGTMQQEVHVHDKLHFYFNLHDAFCFDENEKRLRIL